jgi:biopolymer transport protein ExbB
MFDTLRAVLHDGGPLLIPIGLCSVVAMAVTIERSLRLVPLPRRIGATWDRSLQAIERGLLPPTHDDPAGRIVERALQAAARGPEAVRAAALAAAQREVDACERGLGLLTAIAQVAPLLGLLGTATGLMRAFTAAGKAEQVTHQVLASGVAEALGTTVAGLAVAIPAMLAYHLLAGLVGRITGQLEAITQDLPALVTRKAP